MPRPKASATPAPRIADGSLPTDGWLPCPDAQLFHPHMLTASRVMKGPKSFWTECPICGARRFIAPRLLGPQIRAGTVKTVGYTIQQIQAMQLVPV